MEEDESQEREEQGEDGEEEEQEAVQGGGVFLSSKKIWSLRILRFVSLF